MAEKSSVYEFDLKKIQYDISQNINPLFFLNAFYDPELINNTAYKTNIKEPFGTWRHIATIINSYLSDQGIIIDFCDKTTDYFVNCAVFFQAAVQDISDMVFIDYLNQLSLYQINCVFCMRSNVERLKNILILQNNIDIDDLVFLQFLLSSCKEKLLSTSEEVRLIQFYLDKEGITKTLEVVLKQRLESLLSSKKKLLLDGVKVLISGQLRGFNESLPTISKKIDSTKNVLAVGISTWMQKGQPRLVPQLYERIFEIDAREYYEKNYSEILRSKVFNFLKQTENVSIEELHKEFYSGIKSKNFHFHSFLHDQEMYPYNNMYNAEKMYFHNTLLSQLMLNDGKNSVVIKIRPDYFQRSSNSFFLDLDFDNTIYTESNYRFEPWGFGIGDQIFIGAQSNLINILSCHKRTSLSFCIVTELYGNKIGYSGHINCGLEAWLKGLQVNVAPNDYHPLKLSSASMITLDQLMDI